MVTDTDWVAEPQTVAVGLPLADSDADAELHPESLDESVGVAVTELEDVIVALTELD